MLKVGLLLHIFLQYRLAQRCFFGFGFLIQGSWDEFQKKERKVPFKKSLFVGQRVGLFKFKDLADQNFNSFKFDEVF